MLVVVVLLRPQEPANPQVQELAALQRRHAQATADALRPVVVFGRILCGLVLPAIHEPGHRLEPRGELICRLQPGHALRPSESLQLRRRGGQVERRVVPLVPERRVEPAERQGEPVPEWRDRGEVEAVEADFGVDALGSELLNALARAGTSEVRIEAVAVPVAMALDLDARAGEEPRCKDLVHAKAELIEPVVDAPRLLGNRSVAGELGHHLDVRVVVGRTDEEPREPQASEGRGQRSILAVETDLALLRDRAERDETDREQRQACAGAHGSSWANGISARRRAPRSTAD